MERALRTIEKLIPLPVFEFFQPAYHYLLAFSAALFYGFPSRRMIVIGVTGTKGKTTACNLIHHILNSSGYKTGLSTTINFKIGGEEWKNDLKQTMPGRFYLQGLLSRMLKTGCRYAVVETSSEGIVQYRHRFIDYDAAVFLNLSPEHLERHKGFENYRQAKVELFKKISRKRNSAAIYNFDDEHVIHFIKPKAAKKYGYTIVGKRQQSVADERLDYELRITDCKFKSDGAEFKANGYNFKTSLIGEFNIYNAAAVICAALSQNIPIEHIQKSLLTFQPPAGRMEVVNMGQNFSVVVDYAHEPKSLESVYKAVIDSGLKAKNKKLICLLGSAGGGRDKWKRPEMGKISSHYCDEIILTNEDPYDEPPENIINDIFSGVSQIRNPKSEIRNVFKIIDRREAIKKAISLAKKGDAVVLTGKGGEVWMCVENGKKIPWNEKGIVEEILK
ncbi:MAG: UDP-N-acetylmuramoyl-L-alanyl-D-glutamate--2,6-diaminopimelate ligase [bacterium]|nr:UDP-N-acetylmuramoyl-L-alanyl-D-glutamate--2,6-diaminopimelate ligase [bacterium]